MMMGGFRSLGGIHSVTHRYELCHVLYSYPSSPPTCVHALTIQVFECPFEDMGSFLICYALYTSHTEQIFHIQSANVPNTKPSHPPPLTPAPTPIQPRPTGRKLPLRAPPRPLQYPLQLPKSLLFLNGTPFLKDRFPTVLSFLFTPTIIILQGLEFPLL